MQVWDRSLFLWLNLDPGDPHLFVAMAMFASEWLPDLVLGGLVVALLLGGAGTRRALLPVVGAMLLAWAGSQAIKDMVVSPRPYLMGLGTDWLGRAGASGFPSTHASIALALAAASWLNPWPLALRLGLLVLAVLIAWSRVALGAHFPSDVAGAAVLAAASAVIAHQAVARIARRRVRA
ncbi:phosphatase PAP2 family protein [Ottowia sp. GY511]|uniref:Phosphatase PAP2 family protein n=1 Tax=Ottowia flava TaxID=2675430 RepID=A0ABW4KT96_9BURK|nr:phosphatase PAP2 family protein [Ottowia sp. GY511]TXK33084.1 phosphatase PAP2 family protein [Ottowia sp. GY511]